jgi:hypothetical protein
MLDNKHAVMEGNNTEEVITHIIFLFAVRKYLLQIMVQNSHPL